MHCSKTLIALVASAYFTAVYGGQGADLFRQQSGVDSAVARYGVSGKGVLIAILDRGIEWQNPDFIKPDGTTRIKWLLDMSRQTDWCNWQNPRLVEYSEEQINAALAGGPALDTRDAVGHGTLTAGIAAGNGRAFANGAHHGVAPQADLIIVKLTSEGAPAHDGQPGEEQFNGCTSQALDWLDQKIATIDEPVVGLINSGVQLWGPTDGTSILSQKIDKVFGSRPGRIFVAPAGDEGGSPTHAGGMYSNHATTVNLTRSKATSSQLAMWFKGPQASISIQFDDDSRTVTARTDSPFVSDVGNGIVIRVWKPGQEFFPVTSTSGDRLAVVVINGHAADGHIVLQGLTTKRGRFDIYSDLDAITSFRDHLVPGRLVDLASTTSAIVVGAYVSANTWIDIDGKQREKRSDVPGSLWSGSAGGPTRGGRRGIDLTTPGENIFATIATNSYWATFRWAMIQDGGGYYYRQGAASGAAPIAVGVIALMLQMKPDLTSEEARAILHKTATSDLDTGATPNLDWGFGKINARKALDELCVQFHSQECGNEKGK